MLNFLHNSPYNALTASFCSGFKILKSEDGKITFQGDERGVVKANLWLRCADRVQIKMAEFKALEFEDLFQQVKAIPWEEWIPITRDRYSAVRSCRILSRYVTIMGHGDRIVKYRSPIIAILVQIAHVRRERPEASPSWVIRCGIFSR